MNLIDGILLLLMLYYAYRGFKNGFVWETFSIVGIIVAIFFSFLLMNPVADMMRFRFGFTFELLPVAVFAIIFVFLIIVSFIVIHFTNELLQTTFLSIVNRVTGLAVAVFKGAIIISIALIFLSTFDIPDAQTREESLTYSYFDGVAPAVYDLVASIHPNAESYAESVRDSFERHNPISDN